MQKATLQATELCTHQFLVLNSIVKAIVPNQKCPSEWRVGLKILVLGGHFSLWWTK